jgi:hypothetical protein
MPTPDDLRESYLALAQKHQASAAKSAGLAQIAFDRAAELAFSSSTAPPSPCVEARDYLSPQALVEREYAKQRFGSAGLTCDDPAVLRDDVFQKLAKVYANHFANNRLPLNLSRKDCETVREYSHSRIREVVQRMVHRTMTEKEYTRLSDISRTAFATSLVQEAIQVRLPHHETR